MSASECQWITGGFFDDTRCMNDVIMKQKQSKLVPIKPSEIKSESGNISTLIIFGIGIICGIQLTR